MLSATKMKTAIFRHTCAVQGGMLGPRLFVARSLASSPLSRSDPTVIQLPLPQDRSFADILEDQRRERAEKEGKLPKNLQLANPNVLITERSFQYTKGEHLPAAMFTVPVYCGPFTQKMSSEDENDVNKQGTDSQEKQGQADPEADWAEYLSEVDNTKPEVEAKPVATKTDEMYSLSEEVFRTDVRPDVMARVVRWQRAAKQQGTHFARNKGEMESGGKKPWKQKGTGRARQGSVKNPHFKGGGTAFGPRVRSHAHDLNKKERRLGLRSALCARFQEAKLFVVDTLESDEDLRNAKERPHFLKRPDLPMEETLFIPEYGKLKKKEQKEEVTIKFPYPDLPLELVCDFQKSMGLQKTLFVDDIRRSNWSRLSSTLYRDADKRKRVFQYLPAEGLNVQSVLMYKEICITKNALALLESRLSERVQRFHRWKKKGVVFTKENYDQHMQAWSRRLEIRRRQNQSV